MAPTDAVALISEDWIPHLVKAPKLIQSLGLCMAMAATQEASQIELPETQGVRHRDLASNLVGIAHQGQNSFIETYGDMFQTAVKTNNMGRVGGVVDQILDHFGDASAERAIKRLLDRLQSDVNACSQAGQRTKKSFCDWRGNVLDLHRGLTGAQNDMNKNISNVETAMKTSYGNRARIQFDLKQALEEREIANEKHEKALQEQGAREAQLDSYAHQAGQFALSFQFGMVGAIIGAGISGYLSASAARDVANAEAALEQKRRLAREMDSKIQSIEIDLETFLIEKHGMDHLRNAIKKVLEMLVGLTDNINALMKYFETMNVTINVMITEHDTQLKSIAEDRANGVKLEKAELEGFHKSALTFKQEALAIHALSSLYGKVITEVINPGFSLIVDFSRHTEGESAMVVAKKQDGLQQYKDDAERLCRSSALEANRALCVRMEELERAHSKKKVPKIKEKEESREGRRGFRRFRSSRS